MKMTVPLTMPMDVASHNDRILVDEEGSIKDEKQVLSSVEQPQVLTRKFNFWTALGFTVCISGTWEGIAASIAQVLTEAGPVGLLYGYILVAVGMMIVAACIAELASIWPSSGAQYHWIAELAPPKHRGLLSFIGGWLTFGYIWLAGASAAMGVAVQTQAYAMLVHPEYAANAQRWHAYVIYLAVFAIYTLVNYFAPNLLHTVNISGIVMHVIGFVVTLIVMGVMTKEKHSSEYVFTGHSNTSGWKSDGVSFCIGLLTVNYGFGGVDTAAHFAEEMKDVRRSVPRAIVTAVFVNAVITGPWLIMLLYCLGDLDATLASPIGMISPITQIWANSTGNIGVSIFMAAIGTYIAFIAGMDCVGSAARTLWAMSRDGAFPLRFHRVQTCILVVAFTQATIAVIYIGNPTAFYGFMSGLLVLYMMSCGMSFALHIYAKLSGRTPIYGPWNLGRWSLTLNILALCWTIFTSIFFCFPLYQPVTAELMNYASVIVAGLAIMGISWYFLYTRGQFSGPTLIFDEDGHIIVITDAPLSSPPTHTSASNGDTQALGPVKE